MSAVPDTFRRFVQTLAASLDEHDARGDELAARLYMSRAHVDRVVKAASGESPGAFRRRILLERAAYRLVSGDDSVLDVAVEAGYSSHEAFTRAFQRAYGDAPSAWRRRPRRVQLASPNGVHFYPPGGLRFPAERKVSTMDLLVTMTEHHIWLIHAMADRATRLEPDQLDAPIEVGVDGIDTNPTIRSLLSRLVGQMDMWNAAMDNRPYDFSVEQHESLASMRQRLADVGPDFLGRVRDVCERGALDETFVDATGGAPYFFTYGAMIAHVITYAAHRRTLVCGALSSAGITDLEDDPLAWEPIRAAGQTAP